MNNSVLIGAAALILGGAGGYIIGQGGSADAGSADAALAETNASKSSRLASDAVAGSGSAASSSRSGSAKSFREIMLEPGQTRRLQSLIDYYATLGPDEFEAEVAKLEDLPFGDRMLAGTLLFARWAEVAPEEAMAFAQTMGREGFFARPSILRSWASTDPVAAARYYADNPDDFGGFGGRRGAGGDAAGQIAREWAKQDPQAALDWALGLDERASRDAVGDIFAQVALEDPAKAAEMAASLSGDQLSEAHESIAREWSRKDWDAAEQWINSLPTDQRDVAMAEAIQGLADSDPALAAAKVASLSDGEAIADAVRSVARNWSEVDPAATAEWLVQQNSEDLGGPMRDTMRNWANDDPIAALEFVNAQPDGELRDTAAASYIMSNRDGDIQQSLDLASTIYDDDSRGRSIGVTVARWAREDEASAMQYLQETPDLTDDQRNRITNWVQREGDGGGRGGPRGFGGRGR